jgi:TRAP-type C4-dicarboxylate transport system permease small subunit
MKRFLAVVKGASSVLSAVAGAALAFLMLLTVADVVLRIFGRPIVGTYELVAVTGAVAIGLSLPITSWVRGHIYVDSFVERLPRPARTVIAVATRLLVFCLFLLAGWNLLRYAGSLRRAGEVTPTLHVPFYPVVIGVAVSCLVECVVMVADIVRTLRGGDE